MSAVEYIPITARDRNGYLIVRTTRSQVSVRRRSQEFGEEFRNFMRVVGNWTQKRNHVVHNLETRDNDKIQFHTRKRRRNMKKYIKWDAIHKYSEEDAECAKRAHNLTKTRS